MYDEKKTLILGAGATGLAAAYATGFKIYEASAHPGGICSSYYIRRGQSQKLHERSSDEEDYRFEIGGGHWIFGGDTETLNFIETLAPTKSYERISSVFLRKENICIPYPIQANLSSLPAPIALQAAADISRPSDANVSTMREWLVASFGSTLCELFFFPFHDLYTAGLWTEIAPQDSYKSPMKQNSQKEEVSKKNKGVGYNATFRYPEDGLGELFQRIAKQCNVEYNKRVIKIDTGGKAIHFKDGTAKTYEKLISTLPLNVVCSLGEIRTEAKPDPYTSVLVVNIGGRKGGQCPKDHWIYFPESKSGFHRVGFYSNVDESFLPRSMRGNNSSVSLYVEKAYIGGMKPTDTEIEKLCDSIVTELQGLGFLEEVHVVDPTWIDVAYTWTYPNSQWRAEALMRLQEHDIDQVGRYGRWQFQGIVESIREGLEAGKLREPG